MSDKFKLSLCNGKYEYEYDAGKQTVWRNGKQWDSMSLQLVGNKFVYSLAVELDEANKQLAEITRLRSDLALAQGQRDASEREIERLRDENAGLRAERDEADRRAGAAERMQEYAREAAYARDSWLRKAKEQWGVNYNVSFDVVWSEALSMKSEVGRLADSCNLKHSRIVELENETASLHAENEALKKDAARYRWLRESEITDSLLRSDRRGIYLPQRHALDAVIDAAMQEGE